MSDFFEKYHAIQIAMIETCKWFVRNKADYIYLYCSCEGGVYSVNHFYCFNGEMIQRHEVARYLDKCSYKIDEQIEVLCMLNDDMKRLIGLCIEYQQSIPSEIKMIYDVKCDCLDKSYQYGPIWSSKHSKKTVIEIEDEWFESLRVLNK